MLGARPSEWAMKFASERARTLLEIASASKVHKQYGDARERTSFSQKQAWTVSKRVTLEKNVYFGHPPMHASSRQLLL